MGGEGEGSVLLTRSVCRFHWMRDAGLSAKAWMDVNNNDYNAVREVMEGYARWTGIVQHKADPNDIDVRVEVRSVCAYLSHHCDIPSPSSP